MSKILTASVQAGVVQVNGLPLPDVILLSQGLSESEGVLVLDEDRAYYLTNHGVDLNSTLEKLIDVLGKIQEGLTACSDSLTTLDTSAFLIGAVGAVPAPPLAVADILGVTTAVTDIGAIVSELETLKGALR